MKMINGISSQIQLLIFSFLIIVDLTNCKDPDEDKAYEFGFTIEGMQHRHEKKDVNGIIQGEFGFITADGVYHVTVYATDENGNFRILSMKNIKISPPLDGSPDYSGSKIEKPRLPLDPVQVQKRTDTEITTKSPFRKPFTTQPTLKPACAGCGYVTTPKSSQGFPTKSGDFGVSRNQIRTVQPPLQENSKSSGVKPQQFQENSRFNGVSGVKSQQFQGNSEFYEDSKSTGNPGVQPPQSQLTGPGNSLPQPEVGFPGPGAEPLQPQDNSRSPGNPGMLSNRFSDPQKAPIHSSKRTPVEVSNGFIKIPGNPDIEIKDKYPGMVDGLPAGIEEKDITGILYRFNWTVGFQGHYEKGYLNGAKIGGYFVNGSDGFSRVVTYVADERGYRAKTKLINIGIDSPETPKDDRTYELKSFEFVWYPVE